MPIVLEACASHWPGSSMDREYAGTLASREAFCSVELSHSSIWNSVQHTLCFHYHCGLNIPSANLADFNVKINSESEHHLLTPRYEVRAMEIARPRPARGSDLSSKSIGHATKSFQALKKLLSSAPSPPASTSSPTLSDSIEPPRSCSSTDLSLQNSNASSAGSSSSRSTVLSDCDTDSLQIRQISRGKHGLFQVEKKAYISPTMPIPQEVVDLWEEHIRERLENCLLQCYPATRGRDPSLALELESAATIISGILTDSPSTLCGTPAKFTDLRANNAFLEGDFIIGGLILLDGKVYGLTVGHIFQSDPQSQFEETSAVQTFGDNDDVLSNSQEEPNSPKLKESQNRAFYKENKKVLEHVGMYHLIFKRKVCDCHQRKLTNGLYYEIVEDRLGLDRHQE
ncbi:hypothetical protein MMC17_006330 [Xylographa soralifera]|nr:hypothetical protein [Xylographa soralifera]